MKLNLGCGKEILKDYINIDIEDFGQEITLDLRKGIPSKFNLVDEIKMKHFLEHLDREEVISMMDECYRVLKKGGIVNIEVPSKDGGEAYLLEHKTFFSQDTFLYSACFKKWKIKEIIKNEKQRLFVKLIKE